VVKLYTEPIQKIAPWQAVQRAQAANKQRLFAYGTSIPLYRQKTGLTISNRKEEHQVSNQNKPTMRQFLAWEVASRDTIDFKKIYVDMAGGDLIAGLLLSQLVYWHLPNAEGRGKMRIRRDGHYWIAKTDAEWFDEIRLTKRRVQRAARILEEVGLLEKKLYRFNGHATNHYRLIAPRFLELWDQCREAYAQDLDDDWS
jgi:hypothetical protein